MTEKSFSNELQRVLARDDATALAQHLEAYYASYKDLAAGRPTETTSASDAIYDASVNDPETAVAYAVLAMANYDDEAFLYYVAAGPLEDALRKAPPELVDRTIAEARKTPRFRWMLNGVYPHAIRKDVAERIHAELDLWVEEYPMPQRPWA